MKAKEEKMPKKTIITKYACDFCLTEYSSKEDALNCEKRGIAIPEFKLHQVAAIIQFGTRSFLRTVSGLEVEIRNGLNVVIAGEDRGDESEWVNPHLLPFYYDVWIPVPAIHKREIARVSRDNLKKISVKDNARCPICGATVIVTKIKCGAYLEFGSGLPLMKNLPVCRCPVCKTEFFTSKQSGFAEAVMRKNTKKPLADTKLLVRNREFQH